MTDSKWLNLQLFAGEGAGDGGGEGGQSGVNDVDAGHQRLLELGVPAEKLRNRAKKNAVKLPQRAAADAPNTQNEQQTDEQAAAAATPTEETETDKPKKPTFKELMEDPDYNQEMQATIRARLKTANAAEEAMKKLAPALEVLARQRGLDPANIDYDALAQSINNDDGFYEAKALEMGVSVETAKKLDQEERATARQQRVEAQTLEQQKIQQHIQKLQEQGEALKATFPNFDLRKELQNPIFARMTAPNVGLSVEDAYYAIHRKEIQTAAMQATAQKTAQMISNNIQAGQRRPAESGTSSQAPSTTTFNYSKASREQREALKKEIYAAQARGEKLYPGR